MKGSELSEYTEGSFVGLEWDKIMIWIVTQGPLYTGGLELFNTDLWGSMDPKTSEV